MTASPELVKALITAGADVNAKDRRGENALHKLAWYGYPEKNVKTAQVLLAAGADIIARNKDGKTPLDILEANGYRNENLVRLYRKHSGMALSKSKIKGCK
jgi:ankyrin repeat protein